MKRFLRRTLPKLAVVLCLVSASCSKCGGQESGPNATTVVEPPVAAPDDLLGDVYLGTPNTTWGRLQRNVGGAAGILPTTAGGLIAIAFGMDPVFSAEVDGTSPAFGVIAGAPAEPGWAFAVRLVDVRRARGILLDGDTARFSPRESGDVTELVPKGNEQPQSVAAIGLTRGGFLLFAKSSAELVRLGPYAARTLPSRPLPTTGSAVVDVPRAALSARVKPKLEASWADAKAFLLAMDDKSRADHGGRAPDYGDPKAIIAALDGLVRARLDVFGDLDRLRLSFDVAEEGALMLASMTPSSGGGPATKWVTGMKTGDAASVLALPVTSALAMTTRDGEGARAVQGEDLEKVLKDSLGPRLGEGDAKKLHDVVEDWTKSRDETLGGSLLWEEPRGFFLRGAVKDGDAAGRALRGVLDLARISPFKDALRIREVATSSDDAPPLGKVSVATITREPPKPEAGKDAGAPKAKPAKPSSVGMAWLVDGSGLDLSTGDEPVLTLRHAARPDRKLGDEPAVVKAVGPLGTTASTIMIAQPLRFDPTRANLPVAPLVVGIGRQDKDAFVRVDIANGVLREVTRMMMMR